MRWGIALLVLLLAWSSATASACSYLRCADYRALPPDGATDVPLNVELEAIGDDFSHATPTGAPLELRLVETDAVVAIEAARTPGRMRAVGGLAPRTRYELHGRSRDADCTGVDMVLLATFTTGDATDDTAPSIPTARGGACRVAVCTDGACCGPYVAATSDATWVATDDGVLPIFFAFGAPDGQRLGRTNGVWVDLVAQQSAATVTFAPMPGRASEGIFAIDAAGNVSAMGSLAAPDFSCAPTPAEAASLLACDAGTCSDAATSPDAATPSPDAAVPSLDAAVAMDAGTTSTPASGCHASPGRPASSLAIGSLALVALVRSRRRRSRAPAPGPSR